MNGLIGPKRGRGHSEGNAGLPLFLYFLYFPAFLMPFLHFLFFPAFLMEFLYFPVFLWKNVFLSGQCYFSCQKMQFVCGSVWFCILRMCKPFFFSGIADGTHFSNFSRSKMKQKFKGHTCLIFLYFPRNSCFFPAFFYIHIPVFSCFFLNAFWEACIRIVQVAIEGGG